MRIQRVLLLLTALTALFVLLGTGIAFHTKATIQDIFALNQLRKSQGYYLSEFEWEMLAAAHYLDTGHYVRALTLLQAIHARLSNPELLARPPESQAPHARLEFYRCMQNPDTGAFMRDDSLPLFTFIGPTANMLALLEELSKQAGEPLELRHPLAFLDEMDRPETLVPLLDQASRVGWIGAKFKTPYVCVAELGELARTCERLGLHEFSPEWKRALLDWFYANQDPETGLWGPRSRSDGSLLHGGSLTESERVIKLFVDRQGNQLHPDYPLRNADRIIASTLNKLTTPMPQDLDELHEWILARDHGTRFMTRYLWSSASQESRQAVRALMEDFMVLRFERYYVEQDGAFSLYPDALAADLDGTGEAMGMYGYAGILDSREQQRLWGDYESTIQDLGTVPATGITAQSFDPVSAWPGINSIRAYANPPEGDFLGSVALVYYPKETRVLDAVELLAKVSAWLDATPQHMGNWVTKQSIREALQGIDPRGAPIFRQEPVQEADGILRDQGQLVLVGFDRLQTPLCIMRYRCAD